MILGSEGFFQICLNVADLDPKLDLIKVQLKYWKPSQGFRLQTSSESCWRGLGGSSLTISLLKAFELFCGQRFFSLTRLWMWLIT